MPEARPVDVRWQSEREFFDALEYSTAPLDPRVIARYQTCRKPWQPAEFPFFLAGNLRGSQILEIGCGDGTNAILLAMKGATVVGLDISERAIQAAKTRAAHHGLAERIEFYCCPLEQFEESRRFDLVIGWAVLHHVIPVLESTLRQLRARTRDNGRLIFSEPVSGSRAIRRLRLLLPIELSGTPDERPLERAELDLIRRTFSTTREYYFAAALRFGQFVLPGYDYENARPFGRFLHDALARTDQILLRTLRLRVLASNVVFDCRP